jgi:hypothetical protein
VELGAGFFSFVVVSNVVDGSRGVGLEVLLALGHETLEALDVFPLRLVVQHVRHVLAANITSLQHISGVKTVTIFLRFRFRLLVMAPVPAFEKLRSRFRSRLLTSYGNIAFLRSKLFYKGKIYE